MRHLVEYLIRIVVVLTNILPFNALVVYAASADTTSPEAVARLAGIPPLPFSASAFPAAPANELSTYFLPDVTPLEWPAAPAKVDSLPADASAFARPAGLSLSRPAALTALEAVSASVPDSTSAEFLPGWFAPEPVPASSAELLPGWFAPEPVPASSAELLPGWFAPADSPSASPQRRPIAAAQLAVTVSGPPRANAGGIGEVYTAVIRNNSGDSAYRSFFTATIPAGFSYGAAGALVSSISGTIPVNVVNTASVITWTPQTTLTVRPGEALTLTFTLLAGCNADSGSRLEVGINYDADASSGTANEVNVGGFNIPVGRGSLDVFKSPDTQTLGPANYGDPITWTVTVKNNGLGDIYNATVRDIGGQNMGLSPALNEVIAYLGINEAVVYTVTGTVTSCNLSNVAEAWWPCGNIEGDGYITNPVSSTAGVLFTPRIPRVDLAASASLDFTYCDAGPTRTVTLTVTDNGGPAQNFRIQSTLNTDSFLAYVPGSVQGDWVYDGGVFSFTGNSPVTGTLLDSSEQTPNPITLTFQVAPRANVCQTGAGQLDFTPLYQDACLQAPITGTLVSLAYNYAQAGAPALNVTKTGPAVVATGDIFSYTVMVVGTHADLMSGAVFVTDTLPADIELLGEPVVASGAATVSGNTINWSFPAGSGDFVVTAVYTARAVYTDTGVCGATNIGINGVAASVAPACPGCAVLSDTAQVDTVIQNNTGIEADKYANEISAEVCDNPGFVITNRYTVSAGTVITWAGTVFTEALGTHLGDGHLPDGATPLYFVPGSLSVTIVNSTGVASDYTADVVTTINSSGQLVISFTNLPADAPTSELTLYVTYTTRFTDGALFGQTQQSFWDWSQMYFPGVSDGDCAENDAFNQAIRLTIARGNLTVAVSPQTLNRCQVNVGRIDVLGATAGLETTNLVVTFTASPAEIASILAYNAFTYTGGLAGWTPIITPGSTTIVFDFSTYGNLDSGGAIEFPVDIPCSGGLDWQSGITYQSKCGVTYGSTATRDHNYLKPQLYLQASPLEQTLPGRTGLLWNFSVSNLGNLTATNVVVTNTLSGLRVTGYTATNSSGLSVTPLPVGPAAPAVFTFATLAPNEQRIITLTADLQSCDPLSVTIEMEKDCLGDYTCFGDTKHVAFNVKNPYLRTSNNQIADLPACDIGYIGFTVKNASSNIALYDLNITETLKSLTFVNSLPVYITITNAAGSVVYTTTEFTPSVVEAGGVTTLTWAGVDAPDDIFDVLDPLSVVDIQLPVRTTCIPEIAPTATPVATAQSPCEVLLQGIETANTVRTLTPDLVVTKQARVNNGDFGDTVYANPGDTVVWRIEVTNRNTARSHVAHNVDIFDQWDNFSVFSYTASSAGSIFTAPNQVDWAIGNLPVGSSSTFYITGTVDANPNACVNSMVNTVTLKYGCDDGCLVTQMPQDSANLVSRPDLSVSLPIEPILTCGGPITVSITNNGAAAYSTTLTVTVPAGYVYSDTLSSGLPPSQIITGVGSAPIWVWDPITIPGRAITASFAPYRFDLVFRVDNNSSGVCAEPDGGIITAALGYHDYPACTASSAYQTEVTAALDVLTPLLSLSKLPESRVSSVGAVVTWTVSLSIGLTQDERIDDKS